MHTYSFVVPAYNEEDNILLLYEHIVRLMDKVIGHWELIFVNDGSLDSSWAVMKRLSTSDGRVKCINLSRNFGHQSALAAGLDCANGDAIISLDCDLQDPPEVIEQMIEKWQRGKDIVYARRLNYRTDSKVKKWASVLYYKLLNRFTDVDIPRNVGDFRLVDKRVQQVVNQMKNKTPYFRGMVAWTGFSSDYVEYHRPDRGAGDPGYSFAKLIKLGMDGLLSFSFLPLRIGFFMGVISIMVGFFFLVYMMYDFIINDVWSVANLVINFWQYIHQ